MTKTATQKTAFVQELAQMRDEVRVQMHLGSMEAKEQWMALEDKWDDFSARAGLADAQDGIEDGMRLLGAELSKGYARIKAALKKTV